MRAKHPPRIATLLLHRLGPLDDTVAGDLREEWIGGRSTFWYWRETLGAIAYHIVTDVRAHWLVVARGILFGFVLLLASGWGIAMVGERPARWLLLYGGIIFIQWQFGYWLYLVNWFVATIVVGRVVARLHRQHEAATLLGLVLVITVVALGNEHLYFLIRNSLTHQRFVPYLVAHIFQTAVGMFGLLLGGLSHRKLGDNRLVTRRP